MIVQIALPLILAFIMFTLGLGLRGADFLRVFRYPKAFTTGLLNQLVVLPVCAFALAKGFSLSPEFAVGLMILSFCPGGVTSNILAKTANANTPLSISLTACTSLISIVTVPLLVALAANHFMGANAPPVDIAKLGLTMFCITAVPVLLGMLVTARAPQLVERIAKGFTRAGIILFVLLVIAALTKNRVVFFANIDTLAPVMIILSLGMLAIGFLTAKRAGLDQNDATTIALETGIQNGVLAIAVGALISAPDSGALPPITVPAAVYSISMYVTAIPFVLWRRRH
jgi:BASS family bile acid:Na+ symporter